MDIGSPLKGRFRGLWRYRVGDYRILCQINDEEVLILILRIAVRKDVYDKVNQHHPYEKTTRIAVK